MRLRILFAVLTVMIAAFTLTTLFAGGQTSSNVVIPVHKTDPTNGKVMFATYCASCHGADGRGHGPVARELRTPPADLTVESRNNHGQFPQAHITAVLEFGVPAPAHGTALMPVWGPILAKMDRAHPDEKQLRINNLSSYIETLQMK